MLKVLSIFAFILAASQSTLAAAILTPGSGVTVVSKMPDTLWFVFGSVAMLLLLGILLWWRANLIALNTAGGVEP